MIINMTHSKDRALSIAGTGPRSLALCCSRTRTSSRACGVAIAALSHSRNHIDNIKVTLLPGQCLRIFVLFAFDVYISTKEQ